MSIVKRTVAEHAEALRKKEYSSKELTLAYLSEIEKKDGDIGAYLYTDADLALKAAEQADRQIANGKFSPLCGIPFAAKDNICTAGIPTTAASKMLEGFVSPYDAAVIERLKGAGAVILGKTNMDEFAMGSTTESSAFKITKNPLDLSRTPGGSSGGSCAAVASHTASFALGSDTGGSVRQPASFCGCVGLCPTYGAVSRYGLIAFASSFDRIGPITQTCADNALVFSVLCGRDDRDSTSRDCAFSLDGSVGSIKGLKIGIAEEFFAEGVSDDVRNAVTAAAEKYASMGAEIVSLSLPSLRYATAAYYIISSAEASSNLARYDGIRFGNRTCEMCESIDELYKKSRSEGFGTEVKRRIMLGTFVLSAGSYDNYYKKALAVRDLVKRDFEKAFKACDLILSPASPTAAYRLGEKSDSPVRLYMEDFCSVPQSLAEIPALSLPCGNDGNGLPIGMQLTGPAFSESLLYRAGIAFEEVAK